MEDDASNELHIVVAHLNSTAAGFAHHGERFRQQVFERFARPVALRHLRHELVHGPGFDGDEFILQGSENVTQQLLKAFVCALLFIGSVVAGLFKTRPGRVECIV